MTTALALFSGGLDSILSCRLIMSQGIRVVAVRFASPFFGYELLENAGEYARKAKEKYGIEVVVRDVSQEYLAMLAAPAHGYGKNFNPCVDCKILLMTKAREMMVEFGASFLISGEVLGQRPMSQRRDTLRIIERESGCEGLLVRPLCAKNLPATAVEEEGLVDRERLLAFRGRSRSPQMELAAAFGIDDYPSPAGGCALTDPVLAGRVARFHHQHQQVGVADARLLLLGRQFRLPAGGWLVLGRRHGENLRLENLRQPGDWLLRMSDRPGPLGLLRFAGGGEDLRCAAGLVVRYGKKVEGPATARVEATRDGESLLLEAEPLADQEFSGWHF